MKTKVLFFMVLGGFITSCCDHADRYFTISTDNLILYSNGQQLKFIDSAGVVDTFIVDILKYQRAGDYEDHYGKEKCVEATAYSDQLICRLRNINDSAITQTLSQENIQCSSNSFIYQRYIAVQDNDPYEVGTLKYGIDPYFFLNTITLKNGISVDGKNYDNVYVIESDSIDISFSNKYGLLRFELSNGMWKELMANQ